MIYRFQQTVTGPGGRPVNVTVQADTEEDALTALHNEVSRYQATLSDLAPGPSAAFEPALTAEPKPLPGGRKPAPGPWRPPIIRP